MNSSSCSAVICQPGGREQKHDTMLHEYFQMYLSTRKLLTMEVHSFQVLHLEYVYFISGVSIYTVKNQNAVTIPVQTLTIQWITIASYREKCDILLHIPTLLYTDFCDIQLHQHHFTLTHCYIVTYYALTYSYPICTHLHFYFTGARFWGAYFGVTFRV